MLWKVEDTRSIFGAEFGGGKFRSSNRTVNRLPMPTLTGLSILPTPHIRIDWMILTIT